jgi:hypothetical protein
MKIEFTKEQFWHLMRAVYIADWMANAVTTNVSDVDKDIEKLGKYVYSYASEMGYGNYIDKEITDEANLDLDDEPTIRQLIERYDEATCWDELARLLGERDFCHKYKEDEIERMSNEERFLKLMEVARQINLLLTSNHLSLLTILKEQKRLATNKKVRWLMWFMKESPSISSL